jgi:hypothetical protein
MIARFERVGRQLRIVDGAEHRNDVGGLCLGGVLLKQVEHALLDVVGVDLPHRANRA